MIRISNKRYHYRELADFYPWYYEDDESIEKRFKDNPDLIKEAEKLLAEKKERDRIWEEKKKKDEIIERVFAYDYEEMLYQIFAPYAKVDFRGRWGCFVFLQKELIMKQISEIKNISLKESEEIFQTLVEHSLLIPLDPRGSVEYTLTPLLEENNDGKSSRWNVVSDTDMNLNKWMIAHGYEHKKN